MRPQQTAGSGKRGEKSELRRTLARGRSEGPRESRKHTARPWSPYPAAPPRQNGNREKQDPKPKKGKERKGSVRSTEERKLKQTRRRTPKRDREGGRQGGRKEGNEGRNGKGSSSCRFGPAGVWVFGSRVLADEQEDETTTRERAREGGAARRSCSSTRSRQAGRKAPVWGERLQRGGKCVLAARGPPVNVNERVLFLGSAVEEEGWVWACGKRVMDKESLTQRGGEALVAAGAAVGA
ncbi:unnamed protein product [Calypogeia fissa]